MGRIAEASRDYRAALILAREGDDGLLVVETLHLIGGIYRDHGSNDQALEAYEEGLHKALELGETAAARKLVSAIRQVAPDRKLDELHLIQASEPGDEAGQDQPRFDRALDAFKKSDYSTSTRLADELLAYGCEREDSVIVAQALMLLGNISVVRARFGIAPIFLGEGTRRCYRPGRHAVDLLGRRALDIPETWPVIPPHLAWQEGLAPADTRLAIKLNRYLAHALRRYTQVDPAADARLWTEAVDCLRSAIALSVDAGDLAGVVEHCHLLAEVEWSGNAPDAAFSVCQIALQADYRLREAEGIDAREKRKPIGAKWGLYELACTLAVETGNASRAFEIAEQSRARDFLKHLRFSRSLSDSGQHGRRRRRHHLLFIGSLMRDLGDRDKHAFVDAEILHALEQRNKREAHPLVKESSKGGRLATFEELCSILGRPHPERAGVGS